MLQAGNTTYSGQISGNGLLRKEGAGTLTLSGANSHTGQTFVDEGTLIISGVPNNSSGFDINPSAVLEIDTSGGDRAYSGVFSGSGDLRKSGTNELDLDGDSTSTFTGVTTVNGGSLFVDNGGLTESGNIILNDGFLRLGTTAALGSAYSGTISFNGG